MRTKVILLLTLFMLIILLPASSVVIQNSTNPVPTFNNTATSSEAPDYKQGFSFNWTQSTMPIEEVVMQQNDTTPKSPPFTLHTTVSHSSMTHPHNQFSSSAPPNNTTTSPRKPSNFNYILFVILLAIVVLMLSVGCLHTMRHRQSAQDSSAPGLLLGVRERLRAGIGNLEDRMGLHLWPEGKRGGEDEEEAEGRQGDAEESGHWRDDGAEGGSSGIRNEVKVEHKEEASDSSDDYSSMEGVNLSERALNRWEEEEKKQSRNEDGVETSEAGQCAVEGESNADKGGGSEEIALVNSPQEDDEKALSDVTVL